MLIRKALLQTTMLVGIVGATYLTTRDVKAAEPVFAPNYAAVDGINGKVEGFGGSLGHMGYYGSRGSVSVPLNGPYGLQLDGTLASLGSRTYGKIGAHLFWRDPSRGLLGIYGDYARWNQFGGINVGHVAGEGEYYWGRFTLQAVAGVEFGSSATGPLAYYVRPATLFTNGVIAGYATEYDVKTRFFDQVNLKYYWTDNLNTYIGHRYFGGEHAFAVGGEAALPVGLGHGRLASAFVEGRVGSGDYQGVWGGLKFYFGQSDKTLIRRHREDDPGFVDDAFGAINSSVQNVLQSLSLIPCGECQGGVD